MRSITMKMKDGTTRRFDERGRPGGSYTISLEFVQGFTVVVDEWANRTYIPSDDIAEINTDPGRTSSW